MATAALLEGLQALTPDRVPNFEAALFGAGGTLVAALLAALVIHLWKRRAGGPRSPNSLKAWWDLALRLAKNSAVPLYFI